MPAVWRASRNLTTLTHRTPRLREAKKLKTRLSLWAPLIVALPSNLTFGKISENLQKNKGNSLVVDIDFCTKLFPFSTCTSFIEWTWSSCLSHLRLISEGFRQLTMSFDCRMFINLNKLGILYVHKRKWIHWQRTNDTLNQYFFGDKKHASTHTTIHTMLLAAVHQTVF